MLNKTDSQYHALLQMLVNKIGEERDDRTGTGTVSVFGHQMRFNLQDQFPILTTKSVHFKSIASELNWFLRGDTNIKYLLERNNHIWTDWRYQKYLKAIGLSESPDHPMYISKEVFEKRIVENENFALMWGDIGKGYGHQWRNFGKVINDKLNFYSSAHPTNHEMVAGFDQIQWVINEIKTNPNSRRLVVSGWNPHEVDKVDLPPCHTLFQFFVQDGKLSCQLYQRSADVFLGVPFNIASYALLTHIVAKECGLEVGDFVWVGGDVHLYSNHYEQAKLQLSRMSTPCKPTLTIPKDKAFDAYEWDDFKLTDYIPHDAIKAPVAV